MGFGEMIFQLWEFKQFGYVMMEDQNRIGCRCFGQMWMVGKGVVLIVVFVVVVWYDEVRFFFQDDFVGIGWFFSKVLEFVEVEIWGLVQ